MTIEELKAFIDGMDVQEQPTPEQWARIKEKLAEQKEPPLFASYPPTWV